MNDNPIGIFDSGIGGITVLNACKKILPHENFLYHADFEHAPYGNKSSEEILNLSKRCAELLSENGAKAIVAACNTATSVAADILRQELNVPLIGLEPAVKPACEENAGKKVVLLCTEATARQEKFKKLTERYGGKNLIVLPQKSLASFIEKHVGDGDAMRIKTEEIFKDESSAAGIVLGCTHYVFLKKYIAEFFEKNGKSGVKIYDGGDGAARRLKSVLQSKNLLSDSETIGCIEFI